MLSRQQHYPKNSQVALSGGYSPKLTNRHIKLGDTTADRLVNSTLIQSVIDAHRRVRIARKRAQGRAPWPLDLSGAVAAS